MIKHFPPVRCFLRVIMPASFFNIFKDDFLDGRFAAQLMDQATAQFSGHDLRHMFVLGDRFDFLFFQIESVLHNLHTSTSHTSSPVNDLFSSGLRADSQGASQPQHP